MPARPTISTVVCAVCLLTCSQLTCSAVIDTTTITTSSSNNNNSEISLLNDKKPITKATTVPDREHTEIDGESEKDPITTTRATTTFANDVEPDRVSATTSMQEESTSVVSNISTATDSDVLTTTTTDGHTQVNERKWDTMSIKDFHQLLSDMVDRRLKQYSGYRLKTDDARSDRHDEIVQLLERYGQQLQDLSQRVQQLESMDHEMESEESTTTEESTTPTTSITTPVIITTTGLPKTPATTTDANTYTSSTTQMDATKQSPPLLVSLSSESKLFLQRLIANLTRTLTIHGNTVGSAYNGDNRTVPKATNITMTSEVSRVTLGVGNHTLLLPDYPDYYPNGQHLYVTLVGHATTVSTLHLTCPVFQLEEDDTCNYDYLRVRTVKYCGNNGPSVYSNDRLELEFKSDGSNRGKMVCSVYAT